MRWITPRGWRTAGLSLAMGAALAGQAGERAPLDFGKDVEPLLETHCYDCHGDGMDKGGLALDTYRTNAAFLRDTRTWMAVWRMLDAELMPPPKKPQPTDEERHRLQSWITWQAFDLDPDQPDPGRVTVRRLNRTEYEHSVRDLLGVDYNTDEAFPPDDTGHGFDTIGDVLNISPLLMEKYLDAAQDIVTTLMNRVEPRMPVLTIGGDQFRTRGPEKRNARQLPLAEPATTFHSRTLQHPGRYRIIVDLRVGGSEEATVETATLRLGVNGAALNEQSLGWDHRQTITLAGETNLATGTNLLTLELVPGSPPEPGENHLAVDVRQVRLEGPLEGSHLDYPREYRRLFPDGPPAEDTTAREAYARKVLRPLADRAFRRPVDDDTLERLVLLALTADRQAGVSFEQAIGQALTAILASPRFLFRAEFQPEPDNPDRVVPLDEFALASRLSYFLWCSLPDEELFALARTNGLRRQLENQVDRMLMDARAERFVESFVGQWLRTRDVETLAIDPRRVLGLRSYEEASRRFNDRIRRAMRQETEYVFADLLRNDGTLAELFTARHTFLNETLAGFYGIPGVRGQEMRKVALPEDSPRGGLLTHGSFLLVTSNPTRTSPVKRGQFILENLLGTPAPPPPPNVPELEQAKREAEKAATMRELMAIHREKPLCSSCHERMDPPGLAFEQFNALGLFRELENGQPIDTAGTLSTGESFGGPGDLARILTTSRRRDLYRCVSEKLLTYALGRGLEYYDVPTLETVLAELERGDGRLRTLVHAVVNSPPFQMRRGDEGRPLQASTREHTP